MQNNTVSGPYHYDEHGAEFQDAQGCPVLVTRDSIMSAKPNTHAIGEDGRPYITLVWLRGHSRPTALRSTWAEFQSWRFGGRCADAEVTP